MNQVRNRIVAGSVCYRAQIDRDHVGLLVRFERSDVVLEPERAGAVQRRHLQRFGGRDRAGVAALALGKQRGEPGFAEHVESVVAGRAIGAQRDVDPARARSRATGAMPLASLRLDAGQCTT